MKRITPNVGGVVAFRGGESLLCKAKGWRLVAKNLGGITMKKNPGRKERRNLMFANRREAGKQRAKLNERRMKIMAHKG